MARNKLSNLKDKATHRPGYNPRRIVVIKIGAWAIVTLTKGRRIVPIGVVAKMMVKVIISAVAIFSC